MEKCTLCVHRVTKGGIPACVETCVAKTRFFGEINDMMDIIRQKRADRVFLGGATGTIPSVIYSK
jgi:Fe-S-cluster-containing dehydrogenase component